jgi:hypothetical protein
MPMHLKILHTCVAKNHLSYFWEKKERMRGKREKRKEQETEREMEK